MEFESLDCEEDQTLLLEADAADTRPWVPKAVCALALVGVGFGGRTAWTSVGPSAANGSEASAAIGLNMYVAEAEGDETLQAEKTQQIHAFMTGEGGQPVATEVVALASEAEVVETPPADTIADCMGFAEPKKSECLLQQTCSQITHDAWKTACWAARTDEQCSKLTDEAEHVACWEGRPCKDVNWQFQPDCWSQTDPHDCFGIVDADEKKHCYAEQDCSAISKSAERAACWTARSTSQCAELTDSDQIEACFAGKEDDCDDADEQAVVDKCWAAQTAEVCKAGGAWDDAKKKRCWASKTCSSLTDADQVEACHKGKGSSHCLDLSGADKHECYMKQGAHICEDLTEPAEVADCWAQATAKDCEDASPGDQQRLCWTQKDCASLSKSSQTDTCWAAFNARDCFKLEESARQTCFKQSKTESCYTEQDSEVQKACWAGRGCEDIREKEGMAAGDGGVNTYATPIPAGDSWKVKNECWKSSVDLCKNVPSAVRTDCFKQHPCEDVSDEDTRLLCWSTKKVDDCDAVSKPEDKQECFDNLLIQTCIDEGDPNKASECWKGKQCSSVFPAAKRTDCYKEKKPEDCFAEQDTEKKRDCWDANAQACENVDLEEAQIKDCWGVYTDVECESKGSNADAKKACHDAHA